MFIVVFFLYLQNTIGVIDGCHVLYIPLAENKEAWRNKKGVFL